MGVDGDGIWRLAAVVAVNCHHHLKQKLKMKIDTTRFTRLVILSMNCHINFWKVFWTIMLGLTPLRQNTLGSAWGISLKMKGPKQMIG